jgi:uncharacterized protein (DUF924 family)
MSDPVEVLDFWLGEIGPEGWYAGSAEIDDACSFGFLDLLEALHGGGLEHWLESPAGALAYIVIADQFARNIHRGTARAFATDDKARAAAEKALAEGWDMQVPEPERQFFYMPYEHSENPADQARAVELMETRLGSDPEMALHARAHQEMIRRFGRFPARNAALGRETTPEEAAFLAEGGYAALVRQMKA